VFLEVLLHQNRTSSAHYEELLVLLTRISFSHSMSQYSYSFSTSVFHYHLLLLRLLWEIRNHGFFYLDEGLTCRKTFILKGQDFKSEFTPQYDLLSPEFPDCHQPLVYFGVSFSWEGCNQAQGSLLPYLIDPYDWVHQTPLLYLLSDPCCRRGWLPQP